MASMYFSAESNLPLESANACFSRTGLKQSGFFANSCKIFANRRGFFLDISGVLQYTEVDLGSVQTHIMVTPNQEGGGVEHCKCIISRPGIWGL